MLNALWLGLILLAVLLAGLTDRMAELGPAAFEAARTAVISLALPLGGLMALWLGMMRLAEKAGLIAGCDRCSRGCFRMFQRITPPWAPCS
jgi:spore maturation protein A